MQKRFKGLGVWVAMLVVAYLIYMFAVGFGASQTKMVYSDLVNSIKSEQVSSMLVSGNTVTVTLTNGDKAKVKIPSLDTLQADVGKEMNDQMDKGTLKQEAYETKISWTAVTNIILIIVFICVFFFGFLRKGGSGATNFTKSRARLNENTKNMTFKDVAGADEEKAELAEIVEFLKNPQKFVSLGARIPKGVLLVGSPGTGKTLLAKAVAGEAEVPFFSISGSEFVEMFVGMGAAKVRDLFKQANEKAPCIVFIDEIDTIGKKRDGAGFTGGNDEREQTLNQLLTEMDGFDGSKGVVILAATNRPDSLDPALLRPGRFDRRIPVELPDLKGREEILKVHAKKIKIADSVRFDEIAKAAAGASGAELANIVNEAALRAVRDGRKFATQADFEESIEVVIAGYQKKNRVLSNKEKLIVAYHEIGHALVAAKQTESAPVHKITIIPRTSGALGYTMQVDDGDHYLMTKEELANKIATFTGGRAAEELIFHSITTGASNDIEQATKLARAMISRYGMSEDFDMVAMENVTNQYLGGDSSLSCSFETQTLLDKKVVELVRMEHQKALKILQDNIGKLHELAKYLYEHETITGEEFMKILNAPVQVPTVVAESESNTKSENNAESENSTEADADTSSGKVNLQK